MSAPNPVARPTGRDGSTESLAHEADAIGAWTAPPAAQDALGCDGRGGDAR